jgi:hypothetical protein
VTFPVQNFAPFGLRYWWGGRESRRRIGKVACVKRFRFPVRNCRGIVNFGRNQSAHRPDPTIFVSRSSSRSRGVPVIESDVVVLVFFSVLPTMIYDILA